MTRDNAATTARWASGIVAAILSVGADIPGQTGLVDFLGRLSIFGLVWVFLGIVFSFVLMAMADKGPDDDH